MCDFLFTAWADNAMLSSERVEGLTADDGLMQDLRKIDK